MIGLPKELSSSPSRSSASYVDGSIANISTAVGVRYFKANQDHPPFRLFYPAAEEDASTSSKAVVPVRWFEVTNINNDNNKQGVDVLTTPSSASSSLVNFLKGYAEVVFSLRTNKPRLFRYIVVPFLTIVSWLLPVRWLRIPNLYRNAPILVSKTLSTNTMNESTKQQPQLLPIILFSHGLTGTGEENTILCMEWAKHGYIVLSVHHTDGSSCCVPLFDDDDDDDDDGRCTELYYRHGPPRTKSEYDPSFRPNQLHYRVKELLQAYHFVIGTTTNTNINKNNNDDAAVRNHNNVPKEIQQRVDTDKVIAAGFSFGAATAALAVTTHKTLFCGGVFLDGWFRVDLQQSVGIAFKMPHEAFVNDDNGFPSNKFPTLFINSEQFQSYPELFAATMELATKNNHPNNSEKKKTTRTRMRTSSRVNGGGGDNNTNNDNDDLPIHVIPGTGHQNFCDIVFWLPDWMLKLFMNPADPAQAYIDIVRLSIDFLEKIE